jgi:DNA repair and recombination protein RAD52
MLTDEQKKILNAPLDKKHVKDPDASKGIYGSYLEGWHVINELNRIFGFDGWSYTIDLRQDALDKSNNWEAAYSCICTLTVGDVVRQAVGFGSGFGKKVGQAIEGATKEAETDAIKRAARTFGNPFGLALYDKTQANVQALEPDRIGTDELGELQSMIEGYGFNVGKVCAHYKIKALTEIPKEEFGNVKAQLNRWLDKANEKKEPP